MPYLRITGPVLRPERRTEVARRLTEAVVELFTPARGPSAEEVRSRTSVHFTSYGAEELFVGGRGAGTEAPDVTVELSDWSMSVRRQARAAAELTPLLVTLYGARPGDVNLRFHSYPPSDLAVGGELLSRRVPRAGRLAKRLLG